MYVEVPPRVTEFAKLHDLTVTADNRNQIVAYRSTTRRWRRAGLILGVACLLATGSAETLAWLFAGWFAGAVVAELRVAHLAFGPRASASLIPRRTADYLPRFGRWAVPGALAVCAATAVTLSVRGSDHADVIGVWTALGFTVGLVTLAAQWWVVRRPQPHAEPDQIAADDAIRSRSLHVLAGAGMVLVLYCVLGQITASRPIGRGNTLAVVLLGLVAPGVGRTLAYWPWSPARASDDA